MMNDDELAAFRRHGPLTREDILAARAKHAELGDARIVEFCDALLWTLEAHGSHQFDVE